MLLCLSAVSTERQWSCALEPSQVSFFSTLLPLQTLFFFVLMPTLKHPSIFNSLKLSSFWPHIHLFQPFLSPHTSSPFTLSAASASSSSSSVAVGTEQDRLPAELNVTETAEPNSRVCSFFFFFFPPLSLFLSLVQRNNHM